MVHPCGKCGGVPHVVTRCEVPLLVARGMFPDLWHAGGSLPRGRRGIAHLAARRGFPHVLASRGAPLPCGMEGGSPTCGKGRLRRGRACPRCGKEGVPQPCGKQGRSPTLWQGGGVPQSVAMGSPLRFWLGERFSYLWQGGGIPHAAARGGTSPPRGKGRGSPAMWGAGNVPYLVTKGTSLTVWQGERSPPCGNGPHYISFCFLSGMFWRS